MATSWRYEEWKRSSAWCCEWWLRRSTNGTIIVWRDTSSSSAESVKLYDITRQTRSLYVCRECSDPLQTQHHLLRMCKFDLCKLQYIPCPHTFESCLSSREAVQPFPFGRE